MSRNREDVYLVCGSKCRDFDFSRLQLSKLLAEHKEIRIKVASDYGDARALREADLSVTYTCDEVPDATGHSMLKSFVANGGQWCALHAINSVLEWLCHDPPFIACPS